MAARRPALVMPRDWRYGEHVRGTKAGKEWEQALRVQAMERLGLMRVLRPDDLGAQSLSSRIASALEESYPAPSTSLLDGGAEAAVDHLLAVAGREVKDAAS